VSVEAKALDRLYRFIFLEMSCLGHKARSYTVASSNQLTVKRKDDPLCHLLAEKLPKFHYDLPQIACD
jgi:hypothetical protein